MLLCVFLFLNVLLTSGALKYKKTLIEETFAKQVAILSQSCCKTWSQAHKEQSKELSLCLDEGGELTLLITGLSRFLEFGKPQTIPLFGKKTSYSPEPVNGKYLYTKLLSSILRESSEKLISQSVYEGEFYGIFDTHGELKGDTKWWVSSWANVVEYINQGYKENYRVYSHQIDQKTGSNYVYLMKGRHFFLS